MEYRSGAVLPDLNLLMADIKKEAADVPLEFIYTPLLGKHKDSQGSILTHFLYCAWGQK